MLSLNKEKKNLEQAKLSFKHSQSERDAATQIATRNTKELIASPKGIATIGALGAVNQTLKNDNAMKPHIIGIARRLIFQLF